jgi:uncharacterized protein
LKRRAERGSAEALYNLGWIYVNGGYILKDDIEAIKCYGLAAQQGDLRALNSLIDWAKGNWFYRGNPDAQFRLGIVYQNGQGALKNESEAINWFQLAARQGLGAGESEKSCKRGK